MKFAALPGSGQGGICESEPAVVDVLIAVGTNDGIVRGAGVGVELVNRVGQVGARIPAEASAAVVAVFDRVVFELGL